MHTDGNVKGGWKIHIHLGPECLPGKYLFNVINKIESVPLQQELTNVILICDQM